MAVLLPLALVLLLTASRRPHSPASSRVEYPFAVKLFGLLGASIAGIFVALCSRVPETERAECMVVGTITCVLLVLLALEFFFRRVEFDHSGIVVRSLWHKARPIPWTDVVGLRCRTSRPEWVLETTQYGKFRLSALLRGLGALNAAVTAHTQPERIPASSPAPNSNRPT